MRKLSIRPILLVGALLLSGCGQTLYYATMEQFGRHKRDILVSRVQSGQEEQKEAEEQFVSTYELLKTSARLKDSEIERFYNRINAEYERSESRAKTVRDRISSIERVAADLFEEWRGEIDQISSASLRQRSSRQLQQTQQRYSVLIQAMRRAEKRMTPVLTAFRDQVLFLKHNLNASAIAALEGTVAEIDDDVDSLIRDMQASIREAESFLQTIKS